MGLVLVNVDKRLMVVINVWNLAIALAILTILVGAIAVLRWLFSTIYATGNLQDPLLLEWMNRVGIPDWKALQQKSGLSSTALWRLRDGEITNLKFSELLQVATVLCVPLAELLEKLGLPVEHPELEARRQECTQLASQLRQVSQEKEALRQAGLRLHQELQ